MIWSDVEVKAGKSVELTLEVVVKDDTTDTVKNVAKIDNKEIPEKPETKVANITGTKTVDKTEAKGWRYINIYNYINKYWKCNRNSNSNR